MGVIRWMLMPQLTNSGEKKDEKGSENATQEPFRKILSQSTLSLRSLAGSIGMSTKIFLAQFTILTFQLSACYTLSF